MDMLGFREPEKYGSMTLKDLEKELYAYSFELGIDLETFQSNIEGEIVEKIHSALNNFDGIVINPGGYTHTSVSIADALRAVAPLPAVEVHISDVNNREDFRRISFTAPCCTAVVSGEGIRGYLRAIRILISAGKS